MFSANSVTTKVLLCQQKFPATENKNNNFKKECAPLLTKGMQQSQLCDQYEQHNTLNINYEQHNHKPKIL